MRASMMTPCFVVAELGSNHQGDMQIARDLIRTAAACGVDAVKLQRRSNRSLYTREFYDSPYHSENAYGPTYGAHREALEFSLEQLSDLCAFAHDLDIQFGCTAFDADALADLFMFQVDFIKIASGDLRTLDLIGEAFKTGWPVLVSTGGGDWPAVNDVHELARDLDALDRLTLLQCTATYPCAFAELDLGVIPVLGWRYPNVRVGASLHDSGIAMAVAAYTLGAQVIEKHFTLNRAWRGTDHAFSLEPQGLRKMVRDLRRVEAAMGDGEKKPWPSEEPALLKMSKSLRASRPLAAGHRLESKDLVAKCPGGGLSPSAAASVIGGRLLRALEFEETIRTDDVVHLPIVRVGRAEAAGYYTEKHRA